MEEKEYSVSEAVRLIGVESHVLRYWEEELQVEIRRSNLGHRMYTPADISMFRQVKDWKEKGLQLKAIRLLLDHQAPDAVWEELQDSAAAWEEKRDSAAALEEKQKTDAPGEEAYEIVTVETTADAMQQFKLIMKQMMEEVMEEQNEKLEKAIEDMLEAELEDLYLQFYELALREAASDRQTEAEMGRWKRLWMKIKKGVISSR